MLFLSRRELVAVTAGIVAAVIIAVGPVLLLA
jgi:hypothetical protein